MRVKVTKSERELIERELRRGTTKSRIASLLHVNFETGCQMIQRVREQIRPEIGDQIRFTFRQVHMRGTIRKLLTNSAVVDIDWLRSDPTMKDICTSRTIVNFKDIVAYINCEHLIQDDEEGEAPQGPAAQQGF